jgi:hemerythrin-like domain-containing protein
MASARATTTRNRDAITILKQDHRQVKELLGELEETSARGRKKRESLLERIALELRVHARLEEEIFYPAYQEAATKREDAKLFFEATEEHAIAEQELALLEESDSGGDVFAARAKVLKDLVEHHIEEEEKQMFPRAKKLLDKQELEQLGERMSERRSELKEDVAQLERSA